MELSQYKKRIVVFCDGTWMDSDGDVQIPSNVTRLARSIRSIGEDLSSGQAVPIHQIVFYQNGLGTGSHSPYTKYVGGATGTGISHNIREAYSFICHNYRHGDEIFLVGFSRGAFTVRSISTFIRAVGLLTPSGLAHLIPIFEDWKYQDNKSWKSKYDLPWPNRPHFTTEAYRRKLLSLEITRPDIEIKCCAVWDTVGALGIPKLAFVPQGPPDYFAFVDTKVESNIEYAYQALALDEYRRPYHPTVWEKPAGQQLPKVLKQTWFPGVHRDIGGSYEDADISIVTLAWMVTQLDPLLSIDHDLITRETRLTAESWKARHEQAPSWGLGRIHNSMSFFFHLWGRRFRSPKEYFEINCATKRPTRRRLENTGETIHSSVRIRMGRHGRDCDDEGCYDPRSLQGWTMHGIDRSPGSSMANGQPGPVLKMTDVVWKKHIRRVLTNGESEVETLEMPEEEMTGFERRLLNLWPDIVKDLECCVPGHHKTSIIRAASLPVGVHKHNDIRVEEEMVGSPSPNSASMGISWHLQSTTGSTRRRTRASSVSSMTSGLTRTDGDEKALTLLDL